VLLPPLSLPSHTRKTTASNLKAPLELLDGCSGKVNTTADMPTLHQGIYVGAPATILHGATSNCSSVLCNAEVARKKVLNFVEQQNAAEQAARIAATTAASSNIINCN
jgi:hypothetical protein